MDGDRALFEAWFLGDRRAGAELFDRYYEPLARFFRNKVSESACDDLLQSVFLACTETRDKLRGKSSFRSYLFGVAHNQLYRYYRSQRRAPALTDFESVSANELGGLTIGADWPLREEQRLLLQALRHIPIEYQEVLELHYWEAMETAEIAHVVGAPVGTVKSRLRRGRQLLEEQMRVLAPTRAVLESTLSGMDRWAASIREGVSRKGGGGRPGAP